MLTTLTNLGHALLLAVLAQVPIVSSARSGDASRIKGPRASTNCGLESGGESAVLGVVGPQTLRLADGRIVRLVEVLVPSRPSLTEGFDPAAAAKDYLQGVAVGKKVEVKFGGNRRDRYGMVLGHVFVAGPPTLWLQEELIRSGFALAYPQADNHACSEALIAAEAAARQNKQGHWARAAFKVLRANDPRALGALTQSYQLIEGVVDHARESGGHITLYFAADEFKGLAAYIEPAARRRLGGFQQIGAWKFAPVRLRGWLDKRRTPTLEITQAEQIEFLAAPHEAMPTDSAK